MLHRARAVVADGQRQEVHRLPKAFVDPAFALIDGDVEVCGLVEFPRQRRRSRDAVVCRRRLALDDIDGEAGFMKAGRRLFFVDQRSNRRGVAGAEIGLVLAASVEIFRMEHSAVGVVERHLQAQPV